MRYNDPQYNDVKALIALGYPIIKQSDTEVFNHLKRYLDDKPILIL